MSDIVVVTATYEASAEIWTARSRDLDSFRFEARSWAGLIEHLSAAVRERVDRSPISTRREVAIEVVADANLRGVSNGAARYHVGVSQGPRPKSEDGWPGSGSGSIPSLTPPPAQGGFPRSERKIQAFM